MVQFATSYIGDEVKISSDRLWTLSWETSGSSTANIRVYSAGGSGNIESTAFSYTTTSMGYRNSAFGGNMIE